jgi:hypothetical protein
MTNPKYTEWTQKPGSLIGHTSLVDIRLTPTLDDYKAYPLLKKATPIQYVINEGEALVIPAGWWHSVLSHSDTYFCNFWSQKILGNHPKVIKHNVEFNQSFIDDNTSVTIWNSSERESTYSVKTFSKFLTDKNKNEYFWTISDDENTRTIKSHLVSKIKKPDLFNDIVTECNFGVCSKYHCTKLHFDDEDGLLCVTKGKKVITLFSPEDTQFLYPEIKEKHTWKNSKNIWCIYDSWEFGNKEEILKGKNSGSLLYETCKDNELVLAAISKTVNDCHPTNSENQMVYSVTNDNGKYYWELYNPGALIGGKNPMHLFPGKENKIIESIEIYSERNLDGHNFSNFIDEYYYDTTFEKISEEAKAYSAIRTTHTGSTLIGNLVYDDFTTYQINFDKYWKHLRFDDKHYENCKKYSKKYTCSKIGLHNYKGKNSNEIYIIFANIPNKEFLSFLKEFNYHQGLIDLYENNTYNICNDIGVKWCLETKKITKTKFLGLI